MATDANPEKSCEDRVHAEYAHEMETLRRLWELEQAGDEEGDPDLGTFHEHGLSFDYVAPDTFTGQKEPYFRYQISWGGPSDEFRFYCGPGFALHRVEYWFLDWFDGSHVVLHGDDEELLTEIFEMFKECGILEAEYEKATD